MKKITEDMKAKIEKEVKMMLHAHRDCLRNRKVDTLRRSYDIRDGYYGEAFGIMRALQVLGYGKFGSINLNGIREGFEQEEQNLIWWFEGLKREVLEEEGFHTDHRCEHCLKKYKKDDKSLIEKSELD